MQYLLDSNNTWGRLRCRVVTLAPPLLDRSERPGLAGGPGYSPASLGEPGKGLGRGRAVGSAQLSLPLQINDLRSQKTPIESLFIEATEKFRSNLKTMYSVPVRGLPAPGGPPRRAPGRPRQSVPWGHTLHPHRTGRSTLATRT